MVLDAEHGVVHTVGGGVAVLDAFGVFGFVVGDDLDPVAVRVKGEGYVVHAPLGELLLELVAGVFDALAGGLDVVYGDADVTESAARVGVAVGDGVVGVILGAVVVGQLDWGSTESTVDHGVGCRGWDICSNLEDKGSRGKEITALTY